MIQSTFDLQAQLDPAGAAFDQMSSDFLSLSSLVYALLDGRGELGDGLVFVLDDVLLSYEEEVGLEDVEEETEVDQGLTDAVVGQFGAALEYLMDAVGISKRVGEKEAATEQDLTLFMLLHDFTAEGNDVCDKRIVVLLGKAIQSEAGVDDEFQHLFLLLCVSHLLFVNGQTLHCGFLHNK